MGVQSPIMKSTGTSHHHKDLLGGSGYLYLALQVAVSQVIAGELEASSEYPGSKSKGPLI